MKHENEEFIHYSFAIPGAPATKKNSQNIVFVGKKCPVCHKGKRAIPIQSKAYLAYEKEAIKAIRKADCPEQPIDRLDVMTVCYSLNKNKDGSLPKRCPDLTNLKSATDDILVRAGIIKDDNCTVISYQTEFVRWISPEEKPYVLIDLTIKKDAFSDGNLPF